ncbi:MAG: DHH family phosphoesterase [Phycisphaerae bacterium]|nr:DHH family phosphoesterase [Phycisphaerae bacterium]MDW8261025.1 DHH family phosphoesterase [Phycisphaerales bacterium]
MSGSLPAFTTALSRCRRVLLTTHVRPDGDAIGTLAALFLALGQKGIDAQVLLLSRLPSKYAFVFDDCSIRHLEATDGLPAGFDPDRFDGLLVVDTGTWSQLPFLREVFEHWNRPKFILDHHVTQEEWATFQLVDASAAAAGEVAAELLRSWGVRLDRTIATSLYVALVSDTGWFQFANTRPFTLRLAAELMELGVDTDRLNLLLNCSERKERLFLQTRALQSLQLLDRERLATMTLTRQDFLETGAQVPATENLVNVPLQIGSVQVSVLFVEPPEGGPVRISLRSKGGLDCARFAQQFGGGGHARAAGIKLEAPLAQAIDRICCALMDPSA